jgi:hypothetical protein
LEEWLELIHPRAEPQDGEVDADWEARRDDWLKKHGAAVSKNKKGGKKGVGGRRDSGSTNNRNRRGSSSLSDEGEGADEEEETGSKGKKGTAKAKSKVGNTKRKRDSNTTTSRAEDESMYSKSASPVVSPGLTITFLS